jgi:hypothetical protein
MFPVFFSFQGALQDVSGLLSFLGGAAGRFRSSGISSYSERKMESADNEADH